MAGSASVPEGLAVVDFRPEGTAPLPPDSASQSMANTQEMDTDMAALFHEDFASGIMRKGGDEGPGDASTLGETFSVKPGGDADAFSPAPGLHLAEGSLETATGSNVTPSGTGTGTGTGGEPSYLMDDED